VKRGRWNTTIYDFGRKAMNKEIEELLEQAAGQVRDRVGGQGQLDESASRAWQRIEAQAGETGSQAAEPECARFGSLVYAYHQGTLDEANRTLLEEHLKECFTCTSRLRRLQAGRKTGEAAAPRESRTIPA